MGSMRRHPVDRAAERLDESAGRATWPGLRHPAAGLLSLQRGAGNRAVAALIGDSDRSSPAVQRHAAADDQEMRTVIGKLGLDATAVLDGDGERETEEDLEADAETHAQADSAVQRQVVRPAVGVGRDRGVVQRQVGIAKQKTVKAYSRSTVKALSGLSGQQSMSLVTFLGGQQTALDQALGQHKVPPPPIVVKALGRTGTVAHFAPNPQWEIAVNADKFQGGVDVRLGAYLAGVLFHEARHAEQWFSLIRHVVFSLHRDGKAWKEPYAIALRVPAPSSIIEKAIATVEAKGSKKGFNKREKADWAEDLYKKSVTPAQGHLPAKMSADLLAGERAPSQKVPAYDATVAQLATLEEVNARPGLSPFPLNTTGWRPISADITAKAWAAAVQTVRPVAVTNGFIQPNDPLTDDVAAQTFNVAFRDATVQQARRVYLQEYASWHKIELQSAEKAYQEAVSDYRALPVEADAYATQARVDERLKQKLGL